MSGTFSTSFEFKFSMVHSPPTGRACDCFSAKTSTKEQLDSDERRSQIGVHLKLFDPKTGFKTGLGSPPSTDDKEAGKLR